MMLMVVTALSFAALYAMIQPSAGTARFEKTQQYGLKLTDALEKLQADYGTAVPTPSTLAYLLEDVDSEGCEMDTDPASSTFGRLLGWCGPYIDSVWQSEPEAFMLDGWGSAYRVTVFPSATPTAYTELRSCGSDRLCGQKDVPTDANTDSVDDGNDDVLFSF